ncbi:MAG TPA: DUF58 domain-containing protein [Bacteroidales bacterium]|nr:DUF58 domain-containing protein [Bacteroidales bacterium]
MEAADLLKKVRRIEIKSRRLTKNIFAGEYHSAFKGKGMAFSEVREYQFGDDIRNIDWNVTARFNHPFVKVFEEERELTVMLLVDVSGSRHFGTNKQLKTSLIAEVAAVLAFSAIQNNDKIGMIMFSDKVEKFISPQKGRSHTLRIIRELLTYEPKSRKTDISEALRYFTNSIKKKCTAFVISDFFDETNDGVINFSEALKIANRKHEIAALQVVDRREAELVPVGLMKFVDAESDVETWIDTSDPEVRQQYALWWMKRQERLQNLFSKCGIDTVQLYTGEDYVKPLMKLFEMR